MLWEFQGEVEIVSVVKNYYLKTEARKKSLIWTMYKIMHMFEVCCRKSSKEKKIIPTIQE